MALVDYSGSEPSEEEGNSAAKKSTVTGKPKTTSNKPAFQKVVDSSDPHKIRISLPEALRPNREDDETERPSKRAKTGSGGLSGFNALLPAPKRATSSNAGASLNGTRKGGLGAGVSLQTGAEPGFSREPETRMEGAGGGEPGETGLNVNDVGEGRDAIRGSIPEEAVSSSERPVEESKPKGKSTMFKPLSVARKPRKKKATNLKDSNIPRPQTIESPQQPKPAPKMSLFSTGEIRDELSNGSAPNGSYQPMVFQNNIPDSDPPVVDTYPQSHSEEHLNGNPLADSVSDAPQSLDTIASDLNLSASAKRQLLGRQRNNPSAINIVNFNTDEEYKANEVARQSGEQVQHNPVRAIAPGKHSLKQLVNMGTMQADALEESFASGRRNRSEAGSKYGW